MLYFSKAFDKVPHQRLLKKLAHYGIQDTTYKWIKAASSVKSRVLDVAHSGKSFMNITNNSGPSTVPWGTSLTTLALSDVAPSTNTP
jgi:hypothetical protein